MTNYRIYSIQTYTSASVTSSVSDKAWGVMKDHNGTQGGIVMKGGGTLPASHMIIGQIYPCYPTLVSCSTGSISILS